MSHQFLIKRGDREPAISRRLIQGGSPIDLTGASVKFLMRGDDGLKVDASADIGEDPTTGDVTYEWAAADVDTAGVYRAEWEITRSGRTLTVPTGDYIKVTVVEDLDGGPVVTTDPPPLDGGDILVGGAGSSGVIEIAADDTVEFALSSLNTETGAAIDAEAAARAAADTALSTSKADNTLAAINALLAGGAALFSDGVQAAPGIAFAGAPGTGLWRHSGNGNLVAVVGGIISCVFATDGTIIAFGSLNAAAGLTLPTTPPATAASAGAAGTITYDASYVYVCVSLNTWKRAALATW